MDVLPPSTQTNVAESTLDCINSMERRKCYLEIAIAKSGDLVSITDTYHAPLYALELVECQGNVIIGSG